jgi:purine-binding chemotaxis protein CheW
MSQFNEKYDNEDDFLDDEVDSQKDKFITFKLDDEEYAIEITYVIEIVGLQKITVLPDMPDYVKGVINLRGIVIPIIDVRRRFKLQDKNYNERTCIIVVKINSATLGLIVDEVSEVLNIPADKVDPSPMTGSKLQNRFIKGIGKVGEKIKMILNIDRILNEEELEEITANV